MSEQWSMFVAPYDKEEPVNNLVLAVGCVVAFAAGRLSRRVCLDRKIKAKRNELMRIRDELLKENERLIEEQRMVNRDFQNLIVQSATFSAAIDEELGERTDTWTDKDDRYLSMWKAREQ